MDRSMPAVKLTRMPCARGEVDVPSKASRLQTGRLAARGLARSGARPHHVHAVSDMTVRTRPRIDVDETGRVMSSAHACTRPAAPYRRLERQKGGVRQGTCQELLIGMVIQRVGSSSDNSSMPDRRTQSAVLHLEGLVHHGPRRMRVPSPACANHGSRDPCRSAAHAGGDEQHVAAFDEFD